MDKNPPDPIDGQVEQWYREYRGLVHKHIRSQQRCSNEDADDLTEEVFARAYRSLKARSVSVAYPKQWLLKIADNVCAQVRVEIGAYKIVYPTYYSTSDGEERSPIDDLADNPDYGPESMVERHEWGRALFDELRELPTEQQQAVVLHHIDGYTYTAIAEMYPNRAPRTVREDARQGIERLRMRLDHME
jgi:RNA polymerase sigma factor (sigma-70 family)